jgi:hypothetical protein
MANLRWDSCDPHCACKKEGKTVVIRGTVIYKDDRKEAIRVGALVEHAKSQLHFNTPDTRDNRDPQEIGEALLIEREAKGNGGKHEVPGEDARSD